MSVEFSKVSVWQGPAHYAHEADIHRMVSQSIESLGLPADFIRPGNRVVLKPNWVKEHDERHPGPDAWEHVVTHPAVIEAVIQWVGPQLQGEGSMVICDAPQTDSSFSTLRQYCQLDAMVARCRSQFPGVKIELLDLRPEEAKALDGVEVGRTKLSGDPLGSTHLSLDGASEFVGFHGQGR